MLESRRRVSRQRLLLALIWLGGCCCFPAVHSCSFPNFFSRPVPAQGKTPASAPTTVDGIPNSVAASADAGTLPMGSWTGVDASCVGEACASTTCCEGFNHCRGSAECTPGPSGGTCEDPAAPIPCQRGCCPLGSYCAIVGPNVAECIVPAQSPTCGVADGGSLCANGAACCSDPSECLADGGCVASLCPETAPLRSSGPQELSDGGRVTVTRCCPPDTIAVSGLCFAASLPYARPPDGGLIAAVPPRCPAELPQACGTACCPPDAACGSAGCGCPQDAPLACPSGFCCPAESACGQEACSPCPRAYPDLNGAGVCCLAGLAAGSSCRCPSSMPVSCGETCCPAGARCDGDGGCLSCGGGTFCSGRFGPTCCAGACGGADSCCPSGFAPCTLGCCSTTNPTLLPDGGSAFPIDGGFPEFERPDAGTSSRDGGSADGGPRRDAGGDGGT